MNPTVPGDAGTARTPGWHPPHTQNRGCLPLRGGGRPQTGEGGAGEAPDRGRVVQAGGGREGVQAIDGEFVGGDVLRGYQTLPVQMAAQAAR
jgi:hypothetical protein